MEDRNNADDTVEEKWEKLARANNYRCSACGMVPPHSERSVFFARELCGWCVLAADRDDLAKPGLRSRRV